MNGKQRFSDLKAPISRVLLVGMAASAASVVTVTPPAGARISPVSPANPTVPSTPNLGGTPLTGGSPVTPPVEPPVTPPVQPPVTQPPVTQPPVTQPPVTQPPVTQPPVTQPPVTQPPVTQPPVTQPPVTQPPVTQPPVTQPPVTQPPVTQPPVTQPPVVAPPPVAPPVTFGPLDAAYILATARALGVDPAVFFQTPVVQGSLRFGPDANGTLAAFEAKLREIGQFNIGSYNNGSFADIFLNARNSSEILAIFRSITAERFALVGRLGRFGGLPLRRARQFSRVRYTLISLTQVVVYQGANVRFLSFPPPREGGDD